MLRQTRMERRRKMRPLPPLMMMMSRRLHGYRKSSWYERPGFALSAFHFGPNYNVALQRIVQVPTDEVSVSTQ